jgi:phosphoribosylformylglycinamidine synthase
MPKPSVNDPQGLAVLDGLHSLGFPGVSQVRVGRHIHVRTEAGTAEEAEAQLRSMCETLLANLLIESYEVQVQPVLDELSASQHFS